MDLEPNLSQMLLLVWVISWLMIFICKQLKRLAAFGVVHLEERLEQRHLIQSFLVLEEHCFCVKN